MRTTSWENYWEIRPTSWEAKANSYDELGILLRSTKTLEKHRELGTTSWENYWGIPATSWDSAYQYFGKPMIFVQRFHFLSPHDVI